MSKRASCYSLPAWLPALPAWLQIMMGLTQQHLRPEIPDQYASSALMPGGSFSQYEQYCALMQQCWADDPEQRPGFDQVGEPSGGCLVLLWMGGIEVWGGLQLLSSWGKGAERGGGLQSRGRRDLRLLLQGCLPSGQEATSCSKVEWCT